MKRFLLVFTIICLMLTAGMAVALVRRDVPAAYTIVVDDAEPVRVSGQFTTVQAVLRSADIFVRPVDQVEPPLTSVPNVRRPIVLTRAREIDVVLPTGRSLHFTHRPTLGAFFVEAGITIRPGSTLVADGVPITFAQINGLGLPSVVLISEQREVALQAADTRQQPLPTPLLPTPQPLLPTPPPVAVVQQNNSTVSYPTDSYPVAAAAPTAAPTVPDGVVVEDTEIPFESIWESSELFELDTTGVVEAGVPGIYRKEYALNGAGTRELMREYVLVEPTTQRNGYGTRIVPRILTTAEGETFEYWRKIEMRITSYTAATSGKERSDPWYGITASGLPAGYGIVAVDRGIVPWRSWIYVPGYGKGFAGDTGGGIIGRWIDLGYDEDAFEWWSGFEDVYFLTPVPEPERINYLLPQELPPLPVYGDD